MDKLKCLASASIIGTIIQAEVFKIIKETYEKYRVILDPHTAIGFGASKIKDLEGDIVALATAHPCKFPDAINRSINFRPSLPDQLKYVMDEEENYDIIPNNLDKITQYIKSKI